MLVKKKCRVLVHRLFYNVCMKSYSSPCFTAVALQLNNCDIKLVQQQTTLQQSVVLSRYHQSIEQMMLSESAA